MSLKSKTIIVADENLEIVKELASRFTNTEVKLYQKIGLPPFLDNLYTVIVPCFEERQLLANLLDSKGVVYSIQNYRTKTLSVAGIKLTPRELDLMSLWESGITRDKEVAKKLGLSYETVKTHSKSIYKALGVPCRADAVAVYLKSKMEINDE